jgi:hypothetical protein
MAKEFKNYDKKYKSQPATSIEMSVSAIIQQWSHEVLHYSHSDVAYAVYETASSEGWQEFRVGLKGCSTRVKLLRLERRHFAALALGADEALQERIRIANYIGALVRGGQLESTTFKVLK